MKYLGVDFGLRRVGLSLSEGVIASPFKTVEVKNFSDAVEKIWQIAKKEHFTKIVVGLPEGKMGQTVNGFIKVLKKKGLDIVEADETLSSQKAIKQLLEKNTPLKKRRVNDAVAAAIILQDYLDSR